VKSYCTFDSPVTEFVPGVFIATAIDVRVCSVALNGFVNDVSDPENTSTA